MSSHVLQQLKLLVPSVAITYSLDTPKYLTAALEDAQSWAQTAMRASLGFGALTVTLFIYILLAPVLHGVQPDFRSWRESGILATVIPVLTFSIVTGWLGMAITLGQWTEMGYLRAVVAKDIQHIIRPGTPVGMEHAQQYQSLSFALLPPPRPTSNPTHNEEAEVAEQLTEDSPTTAQSSAQPEKRKRGRPKGSKNKPQAVALAVSSQSPLPPPPVAAPTPVPPIPVPALTKPAFPAPPSFPEVTAQNQEYYHFQWRVLNLCAEFYGAADELVKSTPPLVIAQCYQMGPTAKVDPVVMINDAKRICDSLLANPSQLIKHPPPPMNPPPPMIFQPQAIQPQPQPPTAQAQLPPPPAGIITNPSAFVLPPAGYPYTAYAGAYYAYPSYAGYYQPAPVASGSAPPTTSTSGLATAAAPAETPQTPGPWTEEDMARLRKLSETHRLGNGEVDWDRVVSEYGSGRSRHQILLKCTAMGIRQSSTTARATKRRREDGADAEQQRSDAPPNPAEANAKGKAPVSTSATTSTPPTTGSPALSAAAATPVASPAIAHVPAPSTSTSTTPVMPPQPPQPPTPASALPWPMPTVAAPNVDPAGQSGAGAGFYRPRPATTPVTNTHTFVYQNGMGGREKMP
ncbi:hypothetical protein MKEN_00357600 [Mycena kentingensis (nom. inval.)]|nr:hypothetical protein MKEN_00357600 [Mycena kentingensis (nom. inval.)]